MLDLSDSATAEDADFYAGHWDSSNREVMIENR